MTGVAAFGRSWWCRGGGAAVLFLLAVVVSFREPRDVIFWAAIVLFVLHCAQSVRRYLRDRRNRTTAVVTHHHRSLPTRPVLAPVSFLPPSITSLIRLDFPPK